MIFQASHIFHKNGEKPLWENWENKISLNETFARKNHNGSLGHQEKIVIRKKLPYDFIRDFYYDMSFWKTSLMLTKWFFCSCCFFKCFEVFKNELLKFHKMISVASWWYFILTLLCVQFILYSSWIPKTNRAEYFLKRDLCRSMRSCVSEN